ncbi:MAG TPA: SBBP repeat-containing protein, partial [Bacteroidia bacterium]|nr:SBBP repeat-containing protein [Bacteroidia bacterium]
QTSWMCIEDAYVVKFNSAGVRQWSTYYGTIVDDHAYGCAVDNSGNVYISGDTQSPANIATSTAHQTVFGGGITDAFLAQFGPTGALQWATYYGGSADDIGQQCSTDNLGNIYLIGNTYSTNDIATIGSHQTSI